MPETNEKVTADPGTSGGDGNDSTVQEVKLSKTEYDELVGHKATVGSLKRELKDLKKAQEEAKGTPQTNQPNDVVLEKLERMSLRNAQVDHPDDVKLARDTAKKWGVDIDDVLGDEDFKVKLERQRTARANVDATSTTNVRGSGTGGTSAKLTPEYYIQRGTPPTREDVPDRKARVAIVNAMIERKQTGKKFYNE